MIEVPPGIEQWIEQGADAYFNLAWWVAHPLVMVVAVVVLLVLAQAVLGLVSNIIKQFLLLFVKSPYLLLQWLLAKSSKSLDMPTMSLKSPRQSGKKGDLQDRLLTVLNQLEATKKEQDQLLKELKELLSDSKEYAAAPTKANAPSPKSSLSQSKKG